jgi:hypothetical protein
MRMLTWLPSLGLGRWEAPGRWRVCRVQACWAQVSLLQALLSQALPLEHLRALL